MWSSGFAVASALLLVLVATLVPAAAGTEPKLDLCVLCGSRGSADAVLNILLFVPLGAALAFAGRFGYRPVIAAALLSVGIELAQFVIPGRTPSVGDVVFNTVGAAVGQGAFRAIAPWLRAPDGVAAHLSLCGSLAVLLLAGVTATLFLPAFPETSYAPRWRSARDASRGYVLAVELGSEPLPSQLANSEDVRRRILAGDRLRIEALAGPEGVGSGRLFALRDDQHREILFVGVDDDDVFLRFRTLATSWRFERSELRLRGGMRNIAPGDTALVDVQRGSDGFCLRVNGTGACPTGPALSSGWTLLLSPGDLPRWQSTLLSVVWMAAMVLPVGFWSRRHLESVLAGGILLGTLFLLPRLVSLAPASPLQLLSATGGYILGLWWQTRLSRLPSAAVARRPV